jgi:hypothetical protein
MNFINSWQKGNKKAKYEICIRLGRITVFEVNFCACACDETSCAKFRFMLLNFGFEI